MFTPQKIDHMNDNQVLYKKFRCVLKFIKANTFKHLILKYDIESFDESGYKQIGDIWGNIREGSKIVIQNLGVVKLSDQNHKENVETILEDAELLNFIDFSTNSIEDGDDLETLFGDSGWNLNKTFLEFNSFRSYLKSVRLVVNFFVKTLPRVKVKSKEQM
jgi:hypothetical protein